MQTLQLVVDVSASSDSTIALAWIRSTPNRYSIFVANRTAKFQQILPANKWKHFPTYQNPADHTTRPVAAAELQNLQLWLSGLSWVQTNEVSIPSQPPILEANEKKNELKRSFDETILLTQAAGGEETMQAAQATRTNRRTDKKSGNSGLNLERCGFFGKALRIGAFVAKFALKLLKKNTDDRN